MWPLFLRWLQDQGWAQQMTRGPHWGLGPCSMVWIFPVLI